MSRGVCVWGGGETDRQTETDRDRETETDRKVR